MSVEIKIPDIGGASDVEVIEVMVKPGDQIEVDDSLITLESDKASMEIPASKSGRVVDVKVSVGDKVSEGDLLLILDASDTVTEATTEEKVEHEQISSSSEDDAVPSEQSQTEGGSKAASESRVVNVSIPDIGDAKDVDVIEVLVNVGDNIELEQSLITLEGDKATMEIPSIAAGVCRSIDLKVGDKVNQGDVILTLETQKTQPPLSPAEEVQSNVPSARASVDTQTRDVSLKDSAGAQTSDFDDHSVYASPAVRRFARELGVNLTKVKGCGRKGRIVKTDVQAFVKARLAQAPAASGLGIPAAPKVDFSKFGPIESKPLNKIKRLTAQNMHRSWLTVPHVTQFEQADITELEAFRKANKHKAEQQGYKLTVLAFVIKACAHALKQFPQFNASLDEGGEHLIMKQYCNIGIAVDTPNGLVVPVIKDCYQKSVADIAREMARLSVKARDKGLSLQDMSGGCFTVSSLGGIGGTAFTPIVNHPEVAILGLSRNQIQPVYQEGQWVPRTLLPLSLSYDHRVIDGAEAARFSTYLSQVLSDIRTLLL